MKSHFGISKKSTLLATALLLTCAGPLLYAGSFKNPLIGSKPGVSSLFPANSVATDAPVRALRLENPYSEPTANPPLALPVSDGPAPASVPDTLPGFPTDKTKPRSKRTSRTRAQASTASTAVLNPNTLNVFFDRVRVNVAGAPLPVSEPHGELARLFERMNNYLARRERHENYPADFLSNEYVRVGKMETPEPNKKSFPIKNEFYIEETGQSSLEARLPTIGKFNWVLDAGHYAITLKDEKGHHVTVMIPKDEVAALPSGTLSAVRGAVDLLKHMSAFTPGERVRYREKSGWLMKTALFIGPEGKKGERTKLETDHEGKILIPSDRVFKLTGEAEPFTPSFHIGSERGDWPEFKTHSSGVDLFLRGAAVVTSHPEFLAMELYGRLHALMQYTTTLVRFDWAAKDAEKRGLYSFDDIVAAGIGTCRHLATLMAAALAESGYTARIMTHVPENSDGHAWLDLLHIAVR